MAEIEIVGSVAPDEVPKQARPGMWSQLVERAIRECEDGRVLVLRVTDDDDLTRLRHSLGYHLGRRGYGLRTVVVRQSDPLEIRVFLELTNSTKKE